MSFIFFLFLESGGGNFSIKILILSVFSDNQELGASCLQVFVWEKGTWGPKRGILQEEKVTVPAGIFSLYSFIPFGEWELEFPATWGNTD